MWISEIEYVNNTRSEEDNLFRWLQDFMVNANFPFINLRKRLQENIITFVLYLKLIQQSWNSTYQWKLVHKWDNLKDEIMINNIIKKSHKKNWKTR